MPETGENIIHYPECEDQPEGAPCICQEIEERLLDEQANAYDAEVPDTEEINSIDIDVEKLEEAVGYNEEIKERILKGLSIN